MREEAPAPAAAAEHSVSIHIPFLCNKPLKHPLQQNNTVPCPCVCPPVPPGLQGRQKPQQHFCPSPVAIGAAQHPASATPTTTHLARMQGCHFAWTGALIFQSSRSSTARMAPGLPCSQHACPVPDGDGDEEGDIPQLHSSSVPSQAAVP